VFSDRFARTTPDMADRRMSWQVLIMYAVAVALALTGAGLLLALTRPSGPAKVYVFRMAGIMALAAAIVLAMSATAMWRWSAAP
jgi:hypothetical protein